MTDGDQLDSKGGPTEGVPEQPTQPDPPRDAAPGFFWRHREPLTALGILVVALLPVAIGMSASDSGSGEISVHGPQIYTRERLVNDRYQEDSWLNTMLEDSSKVQFGPTETRQVNRTSEDSFTLNLGEATPRAPKATQTPANTPAAGNLPEVKPPPTFELEARRAYRERIRSMIIENQLDDRHDLHGNTLYRLHFDATVLPPEHSRNSARIEISFKRPEDMQALPEPEVLAKKTYDELLASLQPWAHLYTRWLNSIEMRLDEAANTKARRYETGKFSPDEYDILLRRLRNGVLSMATEIEAPLQVPNACLIDHRKAAQRLLAERKVESRFPEPGKPDFDDKALADIGAFRDAFLRGTPIKDIRINDMPVEDSKAHEHYRNRIEYLLGLRRVLASVMAASANCSSNAAASVAMLPTIERRPPPPTEVALTSELRQLIYTEFWASIYSAVTGVDDVETRPTLGGGQVLVFDDLAPVSLRPYASVAPRDGEERRPFQVSDRKLTVNFAPNANCFVASKETRELQAGTRRVATTIEEFIPLENADDLLKQLVVRKAADILEQKPGQERNACYLTPITVPVGLYNFVRRLGKAKTIYTYAINPTEPDELIGNRARSELMREFDTGMALKALVQASPSADMKAAVKDRMVNELRRDSVRRSVFGYGKDGTMDSGAAMLGWQVMPGDDSLDDVSRGDRYLGPKQVPMTALVSLPAWWEKVEFDVVRSWIPRRGPPVQIPVKPGEHSTFTIELPTNFETLDALLFETADNGPVIIDWQIPRLAVRPCYPFSVTIIGRRLWRSTVVTLGSERASKVVVMPNMNGIIAEFRKVQMPTNVSDDPKPYAAPLTVWTSQGNAVLPKLIQFELPARMTAQNLECR